MFQGIIKKWISVSARRRAGRMSVVFLVLLLALLHFASGGAEPQGYPLGEYASFQPEGDIRRFAGETLNFDISFLV